MKKNNSLKPLITNSQGFVLLYALLVASVVLVIGLTLSNIILKQLITSSVSRELNNAYYASNAGRECIKFMQSAQAQVVVFANFKPPISVPTNVSVSCKQISGDVVSDSPSFIWGASLNDNSFDSNDKLTYQYSDSVGAPNSRIACARLAIKSVEGGNFKAVWSQGYNAECDDDTTYARKVERIICSEFFYTSEAGATECLAEL